MAQRDSAPRGVPRSELARSAGRALDRGGIFGGFGFDFESPLGLFDALGVGAFAEDDFFSTPLFGSLVPQDRRRSGSARLAVGDNAHYQSYSSVTYYSSGGRGSDPVYYEATSASMRGPGGVQQTQKTLRDSRSGVEKMAYRRALGDRAISMERAVNHRTGEETRTDDYVNMDEEDAPRFERDFFEAAVGWRAVGGASGGRSSGSKAHAHAHERRLIEPPKEPGHGGRGASERPADGFGDRVRGSAPNTWTVEDKRPSSGHALPSGARRTRTDSASSDAQERQKKKKSRM